MDNKQTAIIEKIQALLRKADPEKNPNEHERDVAQKMAQKLMFKHRLSVFAVEEKSGNDGIEEDGKVIEGIGNQWKGMFLFYIAKAWFCDGWFTKYDRARTKWTIVGKPENIQFVYTLYEHLVPWLEIECAAGVRGSRPHNPKAFKRAFYDAAARRIHSRLITQRQMMEEDANKEADGTGTALVKYENAAVERYMGQKQLRKGKARGYSNAAGHYGGVAAGNKADLSPGKKLGGLKRKELGR